VFGKRNCGFEVFLGFCFCLVTLSGGAQTAPPPNAQAAPAAQAGQNLSNWWRKSSLDYTPMPQQWLAHIDVTVSYTNAQGNTTGTTFNGKVDLSVRKYRFTARSTGWIQKQNIVYGFNAGSAHVTQDLLREQLNFDMTRRSSLIGGVEDYTFTLIFMNDRFTEYGGYGIEALKLEKQKLSVVGALGYTQFQFNRPGMLSIPSPIVHAAVLALPTTNPTGGGAMVMENYTLTLPARLTLIENGSYMKFFDDYLGHQAMFSVNLDVPIAKHISFSPGYQLIDQDNQIIQALGVKTQDKTLNAGLKLSW
jgi:hypothetical protein